ncbi:MAG: peptide-methionine (S)-S-oxide reductase [Kangiellaceae bacterium]|nr:peptide-methionine (S)-S-oxide reductase [Kangiellaceae bacterium]MCW8997525.1 peptide-methionine (S)-S-oxide reductase [Kangiellaceae bacterium]MCW9017941.1 peptide-methionine (S)-S-oxide reductase [Kangiellaceae bacterium]
MSTVIGLGGGCHWCTEGIFQSLKGVIQVKQGWIAAKAVSACPKHLNYFEHSNYSEAVEIYFEPQTISLKTLIEIHLYTHASAANHSMRGKYRSAVYAYEEAQFLQAQQILESFENLFDKPIVTLVLAFDSFKPNQEKYRNYFFKAPNKPFCQTYIHPKLKLLLAQFKQQVDQEKLTRAGVNLS